MQIDKSEMSQEEDVRSFFQQQPEIIKILKIIASLDLKEGCLCAGALRNTIWNFLSNQPNQLSKDLDVIFFDKKKPYEENQRIRDFLLSHYPEYDWDVKNQYYMHAHSGRTEPYVSVVDGISHFPERCTAIGASLNSKGQVELICPFGVSDLICFRVRPTPYFAENQVRFDQYLKRVKEKKWQKEWPGIECQLRYNKKSH